MGHFNTENVTKLTKTKQAITPVEESEVCSIKRKKLERFLFILFNRKKKRWKLMKMVKLMMCKKWSLFIEFI